LEQNPVLRQDCDPDPLLPHNALPSPFRPFFSRSRQKISKNFFHPFAAILTGLKAEEKSAPARIFTVSQKRSIKKQNQEAMFRNETRSSGHSFSSAQPESSYRQARCTVRRYPYAMTAASSREAASNLLQRSTE
jgi:hypothetical protein